MTSDAHPKPSPSSRQHEEAGGAQTAVGGRGQASRARMGRAAQRFVMVDEPTAAAAHPMTSSPLVCAPQPARHRNPAYRAHTIDHASAHCVIQSMCRLCAIAMVAISSTNGQKNTRILLPPPRYCFPALKADKQLRSMPPKLRWMQL